VQNGAETTCCDIRDLEGCVNVAYLQQKLTPMALLDSPITFTGSLGEITAYRLPGVNRIVLRKRSGVTAKLIRTSPNHDRTRRVNKEFGGRATASQWIMRMIRPLKVLADYNIAGPLNALLKPIQEMDTESVYGERHVCLSKRPSLLEGFSLNRSMTLDSVMRTNIASSLSREEGKAVIKIPSLLPGINLHLQDRVPSYCIAATLGVVPDLFSTATGYKPQEDFQVNMVPTVSRTKWFSSQAGSPDVLLEMSLGFSIPQHCSLILAAGIVPGTGAGDSIQQLPWGGAAKIIRVV
jgi:hypothetical protein